MRKSTFVIAILFSFHIASSMPAADIKSDLIKILEIQKNAWNKQDILGFMAYYWKSEAFTYQSGAIRLRGWNALLERYQKSYSGENWGVLDFTDLEVNVLSSDYAYVLGRWKLAFKDSKKEGVFTIIFKRFPEGWRIIHDHSS